MTRLAGSHGSKGEGRRRRWWTALGGVLLFVLLGLVLAPGVARFQPTGMRETPPLAPPLPSAMRATPPSELAFSDATDATDTTDTTDTTERSAASPTVSGLVGAAVGTAPGDAGGNGGRGSTTAHVRPGLSEAFGVDAFDCMILANQVVHIGSPVAGRLEEIPVDRGDRIEAGQVVARLDSDVERAAVRVAKARAERGGEIEFAEASLELGKKRLARATELFERASLSLDTRQQLETEADLAASDVKRARENHRIASLELEQALAVLERRTIRSPIDGFVVERLMAPGEIAVDETTIVRVAQSDPLRVEVVLPSRMFGRVRAGDRTEVVPEAPFGRPRAAEVAVVDPVIDGPSGTFGARFLLPNPDHELPAGLRCQVRFLEMDTRPTTTAGESDPVG